VRRGWRRGTVAVTTWSQGSSLGNGGSERGSLLRKPDRVPPCFGVFDGVAKNLEAALTQERPVLIRGKARMIELVPIEVTDRLGIVRPGREQQHPARIDMPCEDRKHRALLIPPEMKETVPRENCLKPAPEIESAHVSLDP